MNLHPSRLRGAFLFGATTPLWLLAGATAHAQGVTLYGTVDGGFALLRNGGGGTVRAVTSGVNSASRWGLRGGEDLGGGLRAMFQLEAGFDLDTGANKSYAGNPATATPTLPNGTSFGGFNRRSFVGLEGPYGALAIGRDYTPIFYASLATDIFRLGMFGNTQALTVAAGGSERFGRVSNALFYTSPDLAGLRVRGAFSLGSESSGGAGNLPKKSNEFIGLGADYVLGDLTLAASWQQLHYPLVAGNPAAFTGALAKRWDGLLGAKYKFGEFAVAGGFWKAGAPQFASDAWLGASWELGAGTLLAQVQRLRQDNPRNLEKRGTAFGVGYVHALSKRTAVYANYARVSNNATGTFALVGSDLSVAAAAPGASPSGLAVGIRHNF